MKNEINISDNYRKLNIYALYRISKLFNNRKSYKELVSIVSENLKYQTLYINGLAYIVSIEFYPYIF
jgi:hypothetical protein